MLVIANNSSVIFESLKELYTFKLTDETSYHLDVDYHKNVNPDGKTVYQLVSGINVTETIRKMKQLLTEHERSSPYPQKFLMRNGWKPELDDSDFYNTAEHRFYVQLVGILLYIVNLGRIDIAFTVSSFSRFSALPRKTHLEELEKIIRLFENYPDKQLTVDARPRILPGTMFSKSRETMQEIYLDAEGEIDTQSPRPMGGAIQTSC